MSEPLRRLALVGYGKMGRLIDTLAPQHGFEVVLRLASSDNPGAAAIRPDNFRNIDAAIEFTSPHAAVANLVALARLRIPTVTGTTGWMQHLPAVAQEFEAASTGLVWGSNFSIGVAVFQRLAGLAAQLLRDESEYGAWTWEIHHDAKKDAPSGTLLALVETMKKHGYTRNIDISSTRAGKHPGTHEIGFDSEADTLTLRHVARSRQGFAHGALKSAQWILGRPGVHPFDDVLFGS